MGKPPLEEPVRHHTVVGCLRGVGGQLVLELQPRLAGTGTVVAGKADETRTVWRLKAPHTKLRVGFVAVRFVLDDLDVPLRLPAVDVFVLEEETLSSVF